MTLTACAVYALTGELHWLVRPPLLEISLDPEGAADACARGWTILAGRREALIA